MTCQDSGRDAAEAPNADATRPAAGARPAGRRELEGVVAAIVADLRARRSPRDIAGRARFGILPTIETVGVSMTTLRQLARTLPKDAALARRLWRVPMHEARLLASMLMPRDAVTRPLMETWARDFASWDLVDQCTNDLFDRHPEALDVAFEWATRDDEFVKRAGVVLVAGVARHRKDIDDATLATTLPMLSEAAKDERNFVKKGVSWALRTIAKARPALAPHVRSVATALVAGPEPAGRWVGRDVVRELDAKGL